MCFYLSFVFPIVFVLLILSYHYEYPSATALLTSSWAQRCWQLAAALGCLAFTVKMVSYTDRYVMCGGFNKFDFFPYYSSTMPA